MLAGRDGSSTKKERRISGNQRVKVLKSIHIYTDIYKHTYMEVQEFVSQQTACSHYQYIAKNIKSKFPF